MVGAQDRGFDPVSLEIYWNRLVAIADQAGATLLRTSFSPIVYDSNDYACVLMTANGDSLAENRGSVGSFVGCLPRTMKHFLKVFPHEGWQPGDAVLTNDPWLGTGHVPDFTVAMPVFHRGRLVAFTGSIAHMSDIGGVIWSADCQSVYEEGFGVPPMKLIDQGQVNEVLLELVRHNVRVPDQVEGDLFAMVAACDVAAQRLGDFLEEYGLEDLDGLGEVIHSHADRAMRQAIRRLPDGVYDYTGTLDGFDDPITVRCTVTIRGEEIEVDYSGTAGQVYDGGINVPFTYTVAWTDFILKCLLDPFTHRNEGSYRSIKVSAPEGCILNCTRPAPVHARATSGHHCVTAVMEALAPVLRDRAIAESGSTSPFTTVWSGVKGDGQAFTLVPFLAGGMGARPSMDGLACTSFPANTTSGSIEMMESLAPIVAWKQEARTDSGGPGKFRGGWGQDIVVEVTAPRAVQLSIQADHCRFPPLGLEGGGTGATNNAAMLLGERVIRYKGRNQMEPGEVIQISLAGGGGFGRPGDRDRRSVMDDLRNGIISQEAARTVYGLDDVDTAGHR